MCLQTLIFYLHISQQGYDCKNKFIATQGPKPGTVDDFWRMIWEKKCYVVVMIANVVEAARVSYV